MKNTKTLWSNLFSDINEDDWFTAYVENEMEGNPDAEPSRSDTAFFQYIDDSLAYQLEDLKAEFSGIIIPNGIVALVDAGLWHGRVKAIKFWPAGTSLAAIFRVMEEYSGFYYDRYDIKAALSHHDGTNYVTFRELRHPDKQDEIQEAYFHGPWSRNQRYNYTKSLLPYLLDENVFGEFALHHHIAPNGYESIRETREGTYVLYDPAQMLNPQDKVVLGIKEYQPLTDAYVFNRIECVVTSVAVQRRYMTLKPIRRI